MHGSDDAPPLSSSSSPAIREEAETGVDGAGNITVNTFVMTFSPLRGINNIYHTLSKALVPFDWLWSLNH